MIIGLFLGISLAILISSISLVLLKIFKAVDFIPLTGFATGSNLSNNLNFYLIISVFLSLILVLIFINLLKNRHR